MKKKKHPGRLPIKVDPKAKNKMITLRIDGELFNSIVDACKVHERAINSLLIDYIETGLEIDLKRTKHILKEAAENDTNTPTN